MSRERGSRAKAPTDLPAQTGARLPERGQALLTAAQRRTVIALSAERMRIMETMDEVMEALMGVAQAAGMVGEGPFDFMQREEGMFAVVSSPPPSPPRSGGGEEMGKE